MIFQEPYRSQMLQIIIHVSLIQIICGTVMQLSITNWHLPSTSTRIKLCATAAAGFQHPLKEVQGREQKWITPCPGKTGRAGLLAVSYFQNPILWAQFLYLPISRKALKSFLRTTVPHDWQRLHEASRNLGKCVPDCTCISSTKITYILTFPLSPWNSFSELSQVLSPRLQSLFCLK